MVDQHGLIEAYTVIAVVGLGNQHTDSGQQRCSEAGMVAVVLDALPLLGEKRRARSVNLHDGGNPSESAFNFLVQIGGPAGCFLRRDDLQDGHKYLQLCVIEHTD
jgi:hypothetical protein